MTFRKKIAAIALLIPVITPFLFTGIFQILQSRIQHEMKERLEKDILHSTTLIKKNIRWIKNNKEVLIDGKYFDVKSFKDNKDGTVTLTGLFDEEETVLAKNLQQSTQHQNNETSRIVIQIIQLPIIYQNFAAHPEYINSECQLRYTNYNERIPADVYKGCIIPPPKA